MSEAQRNECPLDRSVRGRSHEMTHMWYWRKWLPERHGQPCRVVATGRMNAALIEFEDGYRVISSRYAARKLTPNAELCGGPSGPSERAPG